MPKNIISFLVAVIISEAYKPSSDLNQAAMRAKAHEMRRIGTFLFMENCIPVSLEGWNVEVTDHIRSLYLK